MTTQNKPQLQCPCCGSFYLIRYGFVYSRALKTYMEKIAQVYQCQICLTKIAPDYQRKMPYYPKWLKQFVLQEAKKDPSKSCVNISDIIRKKMDILIGPNVIRNWLVVKFGININHNRREKAWKTRKERYGESGVTEEWLLKRVKIQTEVWKNPRYREHMSKVHQKPKHNIELIKFCLELYTSDSSLSLREICRIANAKFGTKLTHDTLSKWVMVEGQPSVSVELLANRDKVITTTTNLK